METIPNLDNRKVLIIEDDDPSLLLLVEFMEGTNANIVTAQCGKNAMEIIKKDCFDLVLLDIQLGDVTGCSLLPEIKKILPNAYIIAQTACAMNNDKMFFMELGFDDYLSKPIELQSLYAAINKFQNTV